jgi:GNAT superfamily N-acetyltransferase
MTIQTCRATARPAPVALDPADDAAVEAAYEIDVAVRAHDLPDLPPPSRRRHVGTFRIPAPGLDVRHWLAYDGDHPAGWLSVELPLLDNLDNAYVQLLVHPAHRRCGVGRALYARGVEVASAAGRRRVMTQTHQPLDAEPGADGPGPAFARTVGLTAALTEVRRKLDLSTMDRVALDTRLAAAWTRADGYSLMQWTDATPDEYVADVAYLEGRLNADAPVGDLAIEPEKVDAERLRRMDETRAVRGLRTYNSAVRHEVSGRVVAWTALMLEREITQHAWQGITLVDPPHRGHRLGTIVKIANLQYARAAEPALRTVDTWNAAVNTYMIAINEAIGFRPVDAWVNWQGDVRPA